MKKFKLLIFVLVSVFGLPKHLYRPDNDFSVEALF
jgi:hypothetical protein